MPTTSTFIRVSLTSFAHFCAADAQGMATAVRAARQRYEAEYAPAPDYWRQWRNGLVVLFESDAPLADLERFIPDRDSKKSKNYERATSGLNRWAKRKDIQFVGRPQKKIWTYEDISIGLNPELRLVVNGSIVVAKLYLKAGANERLNKRKADPLLQLLHEHYGDEADEVMIIDVCAGKAYEGSKRKRESHLRQALIGQAAAFQAIWRQADVPHHHC